ncbi:MAG: response regulator [Myxococcota bacterium]
MIASINTEHLAGTSPSLLDEGMLIRPDRQQWLVVVAEDDEELRKTISVGLKRRGYRVLEIADGESLGKFLDDPGEPVPDLVISDIQMPGKTGMEALAALRESDWATPVILMTAFGDSDTKAQATRLGATATVDKPFRLSWLLDIVESFLP